MTLPTCCIPTLLVAFLLLLCGSGGSAAEAPGPTFTQLVGQACGFMVKGEIPEARDAFGHVLAAGMHLSKALSVCYSACKITDDGKNFELAFRRRAADLSLSCSLSGGESANNFTKFEVECALPGTELLQEADYSKAIGSLLCQMLLTNKLPLGSNVLQQMQFKHLIRAGVLKFSRCEANESGEFEMSLESFGRPVCDVHVAMVGSLEFSMSCQFSSVIAQKFSESTSSSERLWQHEDL